MSWSDDRFKSTFHRVKAPCEPGDYYGERYSIAFFNQPCRDAQIQGPLKKYPLVTGEEFTRYAMNRNFKSLQDKLRTEEEAKVKRQTNTRQLEARLGRLNSFAKSPDGFSYTIPLDSPKRSTWPSELQSLRSITLLLPELYPLEPSSIMLDSDSSVARNVEEAFKARSATGSDATLMQQINYLTLHIKDMSVETIKDHAPAPPALPVVAAALGDGGDGIEGEDDDDAPADGWFNSGVTSEETTSRASGPFGFHGRPVRKLAWAYWDSTPKMRYSDWTHSTWVVSLA